MVSVVSVSGFEASREGGSGIIGCGLVCVVDVSYVCVELVLAVRRVLSRLKC